MSKKDTLFENQVTHEVVDFVFDSAVVDVFPDMINRSVPGYSTILRLIGLLAQRKVQANTQCYDLGCSLGAASFSMQEYIEQDNVQIIAVDTSLPMLEKFERILAENQQSKSDQSAVIKLLHDDVSQVNISNASMVVLNFTLQFIPLNERDAIIQKIYDGMVQGGVLVLSEKLHFETQTIDELFIDLHHTFKKSQGYSDLEIANKRNAIENVLIPETLQTHQARCEKAGFNEFKVWFQCLNFASMIAIK